MGSYKRERIKDAAFWRLVSLALITVLGVILLLVFLRTNTISSLINSDTYEGSTESIKIIEAKEPTIIPKLILQNELSVVLQKKNQIPPRNLDLYPKLANDHVVIVLYVHNRPQYLQVVIGSLSRVEGISETLLIVSHDGYFEEMNKIVEGIKFCQVKQIFAPYSPHIFTNSFPGVSPNDCKDKDDPVEKHCEGTPDQYGNHRSLKIVSLKHHWWWMMNTVWDGLEETRQHSGHILFIEEDHFIYPNAYRNMQLLADLKSKKCPDCYAANLAPSEVKSRGEGWESLVAERMGNVGYVFNRTVWRKIHKKAAGFCSFDDYNWDITMWSTVYPSFGSPVYTLRGSRTSAVHFGKCGLHQGHKHNLACMDNGGVNIVVADIDKVANIKPDWEVRKYEHQAGYQAGFKGWGGWGDVRDRELCMEFAKISVSCIYISMLSKKSFFFLRLFFHLGWQAVVDIFSG